MSRSHCKGQFQRISLTAQIVHYIQAEQAQAHPPHALQAVQAVQAQGAAVELDSQLVC